MKAKKIYRDRFDYDDGMILEMTIWEVPNPVTGSLHGYKYSLFYGSAKHGRIIGYDNERPKGDHRHYGEHEESYHFLSPEQLMIDFITDVKQARKKK